MRQTAVVAIPIGVTVSVRSGGLDWSGLATGGSLSWLSRMNHVAGAVSGHESILGGGDQAIKVSEAANVRSLTPVTAITRVLA